MLAFCLAPFIPYDPNRDEFRTYICIHVQTMQHQSCYKSNLLNDSTLKLLSEKAAVLPSYTLYEQTGSG